MWRNPEIKRNIVIYGVLTAMVTVVGLCWQGRRLGTFLFAVCLVFDGLAAAGSAVRLRRMRRLSDQIDAILHGKRNIDLTAYTEGELAILENELNKMTARLCIQAEQLEKEKNNLADSLANISHQLKTPLTSIQLMVTRLADGSLPDRERRKLVNELRSMLDRTDWLITALLKLSRFDAGTVILEKKTVSVRQLLDMASAPLLIPMELRDQRFEIRMDGSETFEGDLSWSAEAVGNILKNCVEHTPTGGTIALKAAENAIYSEIVIEDNGPGIAPEDLPHLFERFYKGKNSGPGFGIGLALARTIVTGQNGTLKAENRRGGGAAFTIRFYKTTV